MRQEIIAFTLYFIMVLGIGLIFFIKGRKNSGDAEYFLGNRNIGPWVTALSAQASDMSGWLLMGFPGAVLAVGFGKVWIAIGLTIGSISSWFLVAGKLRRFSQVANNSITIPQYLRNRFMTQKKGLQIISAVIFLVFFTIYVASGFKAGARLFEIVFNLKNQYAAMAIFGGIMLIYTFLGGFKAVSWTDFFQAIMMLIALFIVPMVLFSKTGGKSLSSITIPNYFNWLPSGKLDWESISEIVSGLAWGIGYLGMPHILIRYMAIKKTSLIKKSRKVAIVWIIITLTMSVLVGILGQLLVPELATNGQEELVFIVLVRKVFPPFIAGILLSAILAASMSTGDSQLLVASSSFTSDIYKLAIRKNATDKELGWVGRAAVLVVTIIAYLIASSKYSGNIMSLVENAWAGFGASFGPVIVLSLYWKRLTYRGALAGITSGAITVIVWILALSKITGLYELIPGFAVGLLVSIIVSLLDKKPSEEIEDMYIKASMEEEIC